MDAGAADPLRAARPEEGEDKPKPTESQDDGYETSNSGEAARRKPSSAEGSPAPPPEPSPPPDPPYEPLLRHYPDPEPEPYRHFEPPAPPQPQPEPQYQHFFPKYNDPYAFKREPDAPYDMSQHHQHQHQHPHHQQHQYGPPGKRDEDLYNGIKRECDDPYSFVEEEAMCAMLGQPPHHGMPPHMQHHEQHPHMMHPQQMMLNQPKKRGRKKKIKDENGMEIKAEPGMEGALVARPVKERKKHDRFNGMSEEEVSRRTLPDHLTENLDIIIIGINPGLFAAYKGHHYAGPGNHFWKCLYLSGLTREQMSADEDYKLLNFGIGFTNMVPRATKGSADLTRREIKEGSAILLEKLQTFRPKVAVFNGKLIYEVFSGKKDFCFGKQPDTIAGTNTYMWVMPSSSARCAQLPRAADKVPFYAALKKFRDYLNGLVAHVDEAELVFPDNTSRRPQEEMEIRRLTMEPEPGDTIILEDGTEVPLKKKRGRPKKVKLENGEVAPPAPRAPRQPRPPPAPDADQPPKKKRGRPKKIRPEDQQFLLQQQQQQVRLMQANAMLQPQLPSLQPLPHEAPYLGHSEFQSQLPSPLGQSSLLYQHQQHQHPHQQPPHQQHQQPLSDGSSYFQPPGSGVGPGLESPLDVSGALLGRGYGSPGAGPAGPAGPGGAGPGGPGGAGYAASPRAVYASPRSQGYSPGPARPAGTPQPQYPSSPAAFSAPSPPRAGYGSPAGRGGGGPGAGAGAGPGGGGGGAPGPAGGASFAGRSPLYSHSPAPYLQQASPAAPPRYSQSPHPHHPHAHPYSRSPAPQAQARPYSRSPAPVGGGAGGAGPAGGTTPFPAASPAGAAGAGQGAGALHSYTPSPAHTPYSQHSSPAPASRTPTYADSHHFTQYTMAVRGRQGGGGGAFGGELSSDIGAAISSPGPVSPGMAALDFEPPRDPDASPMGSTDMHPGSNSNSSLSDYNKTNPGVSEMSPAGVAPGGFGGALYEGEARLGAPGGAAGGAGGAPGPAPAAGPDARLYHHALPHHSPDHDKTDHYHYQDQGNGVAESPRLDQLHQHPSMYPSNFNRSTPPGGGAGGGEAFSPGFRPPEHHAPASPAEYAPKTKSQDVASKSLSGLESLVDQIPSIAEGPGGAAGVAGGAGPVGGAAGGEQPPPAPAPSLPDYAPALYGPYGAYGGAPYANNGYGTPFVGYGGGWGTAVMRPTPGYLSEWQYGYPAGVPASYAPYNATYYNGYGAPPPAHHQQAHYLSAPPLIDLHKNGDAPVPAVPSVPSVGFGGFC
ncbi:collagen alpha-1(I) chain [Achroia grisella]|uniref:collagen alpha-1(I) chain n=1 Tax=Achroia grisella TaxID=688607 RepID=UPI0027D3272A|nr:collagen alpha-1(I) chain [Achroia grisella]